MTEVVAALERAKASMPPEIVKAHEHSSQHRVELGASKVCGCFYCLKIFTPDEIDDWVDNGKTALCPSCEIDSVIGDASGFPITKEFMGQMHHYWFED